MQRSVYASPFLAPAMALHHSSGLKRGSFCKTDAWKRDNVDLCQFFLAKTGYLQRRRWPVKGFIIVELVIFYGIDMKAEVLKRPVIRWWKLFNAVPMSIVAIPCFCNAYLSLRQTLRFEQTMKLRDVIGKCDTNDTSIRGSRF